MPVKPPPGWHQTVYQPSIGYDSHFNSYGSLMYELHIVSAGLYNADAEGEAMDVAGGIEAQTSANVTGHLKETWHYFPAVIGHLGQVEMSFKLEIPDGGMIHLIDAPSAGSVGVFVGFWTDYGDQADE